MIHTMRWFGPNDPVSLMDIRQAGCSGVVSALHQVPVGEVWTLADVEARKKLIEEKNNQYSPLKWSVVESLPVHEDIKKGLPTRDLYIENYKQSLKNLAAAGVKTVCYNFMPVLDWSRTALDYEMPEGAKTLRFVWVDFAIFDLFILKRPNAEIDYEPETRIAAESKYHSMSSFQLSVLTNTVLLGLPGSEEAFDLDVFQSLLDQYAEIDDGRLRKNLYFFVSQIAPLAQELGINLCIHPDDPPRSLLGLPRVVSTESDFEQLMKACDVRANGITFCTGSLGVREDNNLTAMIKRFGDRIHFVHLRTTKREEGTRNFHEAPHLNGDVDMYEVVKALLKEEKRRKAAGYSDSELPMRPDHGFQMLDDLQKKTYPGYSAIGRLKALAELRGLEMGILRSLQFVFLLLFSFFALSVKADDGYRLWLKYDLLKDEQIRKTYISTVNSIVYEGEKTPVVQSATEELQLGLKGLLGKDITLKNTNIANLGSIILQKNDAEKLANEEGYHIYRQGKNIIISAKTNNGILYGTFALLRNIQTGQSLAKTDITSSPKIQYLMLNHLDNPNGTIERGYAGASLWKWFKLPERLDTRYKDYARANASIRINCTVVNNVYANNQFINGFQRKLCEFHDASRFASFDGTKPAFRSASMAGKSVRLDWTAIYYHRADARGVGFDRTKAVSNAITQYNPEVRKQLENPDTCPLPYLLWFHHVAWNKKLSSGRRLWDELCYRYYYGAESVQKIENDWKSVKTVIDPEIFEDVAGRLLTQQREAIWWRDACVLYFQEFSKLPIAAPYQKTERTLTEVKKITDVYQLR